MQANQYFPQPKDANERAAWDRINYLLKTVDDHASKLAGMQPTGRQEEAIGKLQVQIAAVQDALTTGQTFVGGKEAQFNSDTKSVSVSGGGAGYVITGSSDALVISVGSALVARNSIAAALNSGIGPHTLPIPKLTPGGVNGFIRWGATGTVNGYQDPT